MRQPPTLGFRVQGFRAYAFGCFGDKDSGLNVEVCGRVVEGFRLGVCAWSTGPQNPEAQPESSVRLGEAPEMHRATFRS